MKDEPRRSQVRLVRLVTFSSVQFREDDLCSLLSECQRKLKSTIIGNSKQTFNQRCFSLGLATYIDKQRTSKETHRHLTTKDAHWSLGQQASTGLYPGGGGVTAIYGLYRYVPL